MRAGSSRGKESRGGPRPSLARGWGLPQPGLRSLSSPLQSPPCSLRPCSPESGMRSDPGTGACLPHLGPQTRSAVTQHNC